jgi:hypothetical protein
VYDIYEEMNREKTEISDEYRELSIKASTHNSTLTSGE